MRGEETREREEKVRNETVCVRVQKPSKKTDGNSLGREREKQI